MTARLSRLVGSVRRQFAGAREGAININGGRNHCDRHGDKDQFHLVALRGEGITRDAG